MAHTCSLNWREAENSSVRTCCPSCGFSCWDPVTFLKLRSGPSSLTLEWGTGPLPLPSPQPWKQAQEPFGAKSVTAIGRGDPDPDQSSPHGLMLRSQASSSQLPPGWWLAGRGFTLLLTAEFLFMFRPCGQHNGSSGQVVFLRPAGLRHPGSLCPAQLAITSWGHFLGDYWDPTWGLGLALDVDPSRTLGRK